MIFELHYFSDAPETAYGAAAYLWVLRSDDVWTTLIMSKGRMCPIKKISIPRLEVEAAKLSALLNEQISAILPNPLSKRYFWTDSLVTLFYICNDEVQPPTVVANRAALERRWMLMTVAMYLHTPIVPIYCREEHCWEEHCRVSWSEKWGGYQPTCWVVNHDKTVKPWWPLN